MAHADACIAGNREAEQVWRAKGYRSRIDVIPQFGVDPELFYPGEKPYAGAARFAIGYVGRFVKEKGIDILLHALAGLEGDWQANLIGSGPTQAQLTALARRLQLADRVNFLPWIASTQMPNFYRTLDVLILPSRTQPNWKEQFGRVLIEAMACGVPVIGSTCGEIPNVIGDAGLIFPEGDVDALRAHLINLRRDPARRADLARRGRQRALDHFTQAQIARRTYEVYRRMMKREK